jgi:hypothetical protein
VILAVDPGVRGCGVSLFEGGKLQGFTLKSAAYVRNPVNAGGDAFAASCMANAVYDWACYAAGDAGDLKHLVIEVPRVYPAAQQKGDQNDLISVALVAGAVAGRFRLVKTYYPRDWKGTIDADRLIEEWIKPRLSKIEWGAVTLPTANSLAHNVFDAIGIGLKFVDRFEPKRIFSKEP